MAAGSESKAFKPAWWLPNSHLQTIWPTLARWHCKVKVDTQSIELNDGDFLELHHLPQTSGPLVLLLHGLDGSLKSPYIKGLLSQLKKQGWHGVLMQFRGCGGKVNRLSRSYHGGETADLEQVVEILRQTYPQQPLAIVGFSLGGNVLLKWLGEKSRPYVKAAVAVSVPFELNNVADQINQGFAKFYQWWLLRGLKRSILKKCHWSTFPLSTQQVKRLKNFWQFDDYVTASLHGFANAHDYYQQASCKPYLKNIETPTLIIHAADDPFMSPAILPSSAMLSSKIQLQVTPRGGHVGFVAGMIPGKSLYWLEQRVIHYLHDLIHSID